MNVDGIMQKREKKRGGGGGERRRHDSGSRVRSLKIPTTTELIRNTPCFSPPSPFLSLFLPFVPPFSLSLSSSLPDERAFN